LFVSLAHAGECRGNETVIGGRLTVNRTRWTAVCVLGKCSPLTTSLFILSSLRIKAFRTEDVEIAKFVAVNGGLSTINPSLPHACGKFTFFFPLHLSNFVA